MVISCACTISGSVSANGWFYFDPIGIAAEIRFDGTRTKVTRSTGAEGASTTNFETLELEERVELVQSGFVIDSRITNFSLQFEPVFRQGRETVDIEKDNTSGNDLDYNINIGVLQGANAPVDMNFNTYRATSANDLAFGSRNKSDINETSLSLNWKNSWFPLLFTMRNRSFKQDFTRQDGATSRRDEDRNEFRINGRSSKLRLNLLHASVDENVGNRDYQLNRGDVGHSFSWGRGSRLSSNIQVHDRTGTNAFRQLNWRESMRIYHTADLESQTFYRYFSQERGIKSATHEGFFELTHHLYENLDSSARIWGRLEDSDTQDRNESQVDARTSYQKSFFFGSLTAGAYGNYRKTDRVSKAGLGEVVNEHHIARFVEPIILREQLIDASSVIVTAEDGFAYTEGIDYEILPVGGIYTELRVIPSGRIIEGQLLLVSYSYELLPSAEYDTLTAGYNISLTYRWIRFYHNRFQVNNDLVSGSGLPPDQEDRKSGIELSWNFDRAAVRLRSEARQRINGGFESNSAVFSQNLGFTFSRSLSLSLNGNQVFHRTKGVVSLDPLADPELQDTRTNGEYYSLNATLNWRPGRNLSVVPLLGAWKRVESATSEDRPDIDRLYYSAQLRVSWRLRQLAMDFLYDYNTSDIEGQIRDGNRLLFTVKRRFR
jgi:hypothetical protein